MDTTQGKCGLEPIESTFGNCHYKYCKVFKGPRYIKARDLFY